MNSKHRDYNIDTVRSIIGLSHTFTAMAKEVDCHLFHLLAVLNKQRPLTDNLAEKIAKVAGCEVEDFCKEFDNDFHKEATETLRTVFRKGANGELNVTKGQRLSLEIYRAMYPSAQQLDVKVDISEAETQDEDLLDEGDIPEAYEK